MNISVVSFDGHAINDTTNYTAWLEGLAGWGQAAGKPGAIERVHFPPVYTYKQPAPKTFALRVQMMGTLSSQIDILKGWFDTFNDDGLKPFIIADLANASKQWSIQCTVVAMPQVDGPVITFTIYAPDSVWKAVTQGTNSVGIVASGGTNTMTPGGNLPAFPVFRFTPTSARGANGFAYWRWIPVYNQTARIFSSYPVDVTNGGLNTTTLLADAARTVQINVGGGINNAVTSIPYDTAVGVIPTSGLAYVDTEQFSYTGKTGTNLTGCVRGVNGTAAAAHADNAVISASKVQAAGGDVRVYVDGVETNRWFGTGANAFNQAATKIWTVLNWQPKREMTLGAAIAGSGAITTITVADTPANRTALAAVPAAGILYINTEAFTYTGKNIQSRQFTGVTRTTKGTAIGAQAVGDTVRWIEHDIYLYYGKPEISAPNTDDSQKPVVDLTSTNTSWVYTAFRNNAGTQAGAWAAAVLRNGGSQSAIMYTASGVAAGPAYADPAVDMGMQLKAWLQGNVWQPGDAQMEWRLYHPAGVTTITTSSGQKYRSGSTWFAGNNPQFLASNVGFSVNPAAIAFTEATPASPATWTAWSHNAVALGATYNYLTFAVLRASCAGSNGYYVAFEVAAITLALDSANTPVIALGAENTNAYEINAVISSDKFTGTITVNAVLDLNQTLEVDCNLKTVTYLKDNSPQLGALTLSSVRFDWFQLVPGVLNTLTYTELGAAGVTFGVTWNDRNN